MKSTLSTTQQPSRSTNPNHSSRNDQTVWIPLMNLSEQAQQHSLQEESAQSEFKSSKQAAPNRIILGQCLGFECSFATGGCCCCCI